jgi:hypothetical protein
MPVEIVDCLSRPPPCCAIFTEPFTSVPTHDFFSTMLMTPATASAP